MSAIAIVGMACRYADARSPAELWENVLAQRQSFRRIPRVRLNMADYGAEEQLQDRISASMAAVLEDYQFDRVRFHVSQEAYASTDTTHWLALDVASQALQDARLLNAGAARRERTGVYVGNSLTGEFARANLLRLRWPYVRRVLWAALQRNGHGLPDDVDKLIAEVEDIYKAPFPPTTEESLAGGLSNTIAGRICNYFDLKGGGYTVDGACASSLLAVTTACSALQTEDVDVAIAGGVDLSLDPFELAGFSRLGALADKKMRVFDAEPSGFWPGEGCGMVVLMRHEDALAHHHTPYVVIRGWGISSDGSGGITRPELDGQMLALRRAYERADYGIDSIAYFEGHGTGTAVGDATELRALSQSRSQGESGWAAAIGSVKANIGHTKAAAGVAGLIKATMAVHARVLPPTTGCDHPHAELTAEAPALRVLREGELWPDDLPLRAGVSAFGFGGINTHLALEAADNARRRNFTAVEQGQLASAQDCELFLFAGRDARELAGQITEALAFANEVSFSELADLAGHLACRIGNAATGQTARGACVASTPDELQEKLKALLECCESEFGRQIDVRQEIFFSGSGLSESLGAAVVPPRIGFLFPGQASPVYTSGGIWQRRFPDVRALYERARLPQIREKTQSVATEIAQPCIVGASLAGLRVLKLMGIEAGVAVGHSLGEITALYWAGACDEDDLMRLVRERGRAMAEMGEPSGAMASIGAGREDVLQTLNGDRLVVAAHNSPLQTVVSGESTAVERFVARLRSNGVAAAMLPVSHAFHSPLVALVAKEFSRSLTGQSFAGLDRRVVSTVSGTLLDPAADVAALLAEQITKPVQFADALDVASREADLFIEVGPGEVLSGIAAECTDKPCVAMDAASESLRGLFHALSATFVMGANIRITPLIEKRFTRTVDLRKRHSFLANPCEQVPENALPRKKVLSPRNPQGSDDALATQTAGNASSPREVLLNLVAQRTQLPLEAIRPEQRFLDHLHLNSITISQIMLQAAAHLNVVAPVAPAEYTNATIAEATEILESLRSRKLLAMEEKHPAGVDSWIRILAVELVASDLVKVGRLSLRETASAPGSWAVTTQETNAESPFSARLREEFRSVSGKGLVCCVPQERDERAAEFLLRSAQTALQRGAAHVVFVQHGGGAGALARTLYLENPKIKMTLLDVPPELPQAAKLVMAEAAATTDFHEAHYDTAGIRREPRLKLLWPERSDDGNGLSPADLLLVTGGGRGIAAESALHLARTSSCRLALLGRSDPATDRDLERNLRRIAESGVQYSYWATDISDRLALDKALQRIQREHGPVTAVLHGAGVNLPKRLDKLSVQDLLQTLAAKLNGLRNILNTIDPDKLRTLLTFGSIIARTGLHGEAHYGLANEWLDLEVQSWSRAHPRCRCLNLEWSVWAGVGMGQRLGVLDSLVRQGITPLPVDDAIATLEAALGWKDAPASAIVAGRFGNLPTLKFDQPELPLRRFLERVRVHHPGIELIADSELSAETDPYLAEHVIQGEQLVPAVMGMEAMAQAAMALEQTDVLPEFRNLRFEHPIVAANAQAVILRVAALRRQPGVVSTVVRCSSSGFQVDHFSGDCLFEKQGPGQTFGEPMRALEPIHLDPSRDLYGRLLFHQGRFRRVEAYTQLQADKSVAALKSPGDAPWFARHLPPELVAGNPASRDAALHSIQACIPHKTVLPVGIDRVSSSAAWTRGPAKVHATECFHDGDNFVYDLQIEDADGNLCEQWNGLRLRAVAPIRSKEAWSFALLAPYLERRLAEILPESRSKVRMVRKVEKQPDCALSEAVWEMFGPAATVTHRPDGKPEIAGAAGLHRYVSLSHRGLITLMVSATSETGCDLEEIGSRDAKSWESLLGTDGFASAQKIAGDGRTAIECAAAQIWTLQESLRKAGACVTSGLTVHSQSPDGWTTCSSGTFHAVAFSARVEEGGPIALGFVVKSQS